VTEHESPAKMALVWSCFGIFQPILFCQFMQRWMSYFVMSWISHVCRNFKLATYAETYDYFSLFFVLLASILF